jgi:NAD(P)H-hydrate epimerase
MKVVTSSQMRELDRRTIEEFHMPGLLLMENAALRVVEILLGRFAPLKDKRVAVVCGRGGNGGDGLAVARHLATRTGADVSVWLVDSPKDFRGDAATNFLMAQAFGLRMRPASDMDLSGADLVIDAIFGTGIRGAVTGDAARAISMMNESRGTVIAVDVPSGLDADSGRADGPVTRARLTITFALPKIGLLEFPGAEYAGELIVADLGMPRAVMAAPQVDSYVTEASQVAAWLPPRVNTRDANKGSYGHVLVFGGSAGFAGAPTMTSEAASRTGAGLVTLAVPIGIQQAIMARVSPVIMTLGMKQTNQGTFGVEALESALESAERATSVALGPGIGRDDEVARFVRDFVARCPSPLVLDADALDLLAREPRRGEPLIRSRKAPTILTPHPGEMGRLLGIGTAAVESDRRSAAQSAAKGYGCTVLLKGARTLIASADGVLYLNTTGNPGMATGGMGDVLTGMVAALLAQKLGPLEASAAGAFVHGLAGDRAARDLGGNFGLRGNLGATGLIATDLILRIPRSIAECQLDAR